MRKSRQILLCGETVYLYERPAKEVFGLDGVIKAHRDDTSSAYNLAVSCQTIAESLRHNISALRWFQLLKRFKYWRMFRIEYLFRKLSVSEIEEFCRIILFELEGNSAANGEKKKQ